MQMSESIETGAERAMWTYSTVGQEGWEKEGES